MSNRASGAGFEVAPVDGRLPVRFGILGAGRIGRLHAELLMRQVNGATVSMVFDAQPVAATRLAESLGVEVAATLEEILNSPKVDAIAVLTSTNTHVDLVIQAAAAGKPIFCEKPISLELAEVDRAIAAVKAADVPFMVGFNKRFDPGHAAVRDAVHSGALGLLHVLKITGRDPAPPPPEYVAVSGGIFLDMVIHDFDLARYITGSEVSQVYAVGAVRVDERIGEAGDVDTVVILLTHEDGAFTTLDSSRRAVYGYDQRIEAFCAEGMAVSENQLRNNSWIRTADATQLPLPTWSFLDRYREAYRLEWEAFVESLRGGTPSPVDLEDGRAPIVIALAAAKSMREGRPVRISEVS